MELSSHARWYREDSNQPLQAPINRGGSKDLQTVSTLTVTPKREDDGVRYRCVVWNRAMTEGQRLETTVTLSVNCKYPTFTLYTNYYICHRGVGQVMDKVTQRRRSRT